MAKKQDSIKERKERLTELTEVNPENWPELSKNHPEYGEALFYFGKFSPLEQETLFGKETANSLRQNHLYMEESREIYKEKNRTY